MIYRQIVLWGGFIHITPIVAPVNTPLDPINLNLEPFKL